MAAGWGDCGGEDADVLAASRHLVITGALSPRWRTIYSVF
jgi:hypothetical protein